MQGLILSKPPTWMCSNPKPEPNARRFHEIEVPVWEGMVDLDKIQGWIGNPRTELHADQFQTTYGRKPNDDEMYQLVMADNDPKEGLKIRELAGSIYKNGIRVPVVLTHDGRLLDGNRRYYASMFLAREGAPKKDQKRFTRIPAIVLPEGISGDIEDAIITEYNFISDYRAEWPYYVKAMRVHDDWARNNVDQKDLEQRYGVPWRYLNKWIQAAQICERFLDYHDHNFLAKQFAYRNFIMFDEMMRNYGKKLSQADFREAVFDLLLADYPDKERFTKSADVVRLDELWENAEAWDVLTTKKGPQALKEALIILDLSGLDAGPDPNPKLRRVVKGLEKLVSSGNLHAANGELLEDFRRYAEQLPGAPIDPAAQVGKMIEWLDAMTSRQIAGLQADTLMDLRAALERVLKMAEAVTDVKVER